VYPVNSLLFHDSSSPQAKFLKGGEENQVKLNVLVATIVGAHPSNYGMQSKVEEQLGTQTTYCLDQIVIQQCHNCCHTLQCRMDEEG
jgi:hypothetical protein